MRELETTAVTPRGVPKAPPLHAEVIAGLVNDGSARDVAAAAIQLAQRLGAGVRFIQVLPEDLSLEERADAESVTFEAALDAIRGARRRRVTFESAAGDAARTLVLRSSKAVALVVGEDRPESERASDAVTAYCLSHARCTVHVVPRRRSGDRTELASKD